MNDQPISDVHYTTVVHVNRSHRPIRSESSTDQLHVQAKTQSPKLVSLSWRGFDFVPTKTHSPTSAGGKRTPQSEEDRHQNITSCQDCFTTQSDKFSWTWWFLTITKFLQNATDQLCILDFCNKYIQKSMGSSKLSKVCYRTITTAKQEADTTYLNPFDRRGKTKETETTRENPTIVTVCDEWFMVQWAESKKWCQRLRVVYCNSNTASMLPFPDGVPPERHWHYSSFGKVKECPIENCMQGVARCWPLVRIYDCTRACRIQSRPWRSTKTRCSWCWKYLALTHLWRTTPARIIITIESIQESHRRYYVNIVGYHVTAAKKQDIVAGLRWSVRQQTTHYHREQAGQEDTAHQSETWDSPSSYPCEIITHRISTSLRFSGPGWCNGSATATVNEQPILRSGASYDVCAWGMGCSSH